MRAVMTLTRGILIVQDTREEKGVRKLSVSDQMPSCRVQIRQSAIRP